MLAPGSPARAKCVQIESLLLILLCSTHDLVGKVMQLFRILLYTKADSIKLRCDKAAGL